MKNAVFQLLTASALLLAINSAYAQSEQSFELSHSGGTDKCGCHHKSSTGEYHCHTRKQRGGECPA